ncbi:inositol monophosphatase family protein [uncultured Microbacterium sp.]|uniref:inositol monophosphatase family protein n=1 Tax=uncultured Microbacterium sp. TaxID=191216 RepID=UPI0025EA4D18|nr:inositol monophosphatase family protein [uncultured Microbacterium sp.]
MTDLADDLAFALRLADAADAVAMGRFDAPDLNIATKADASFVTEADLATERAIRELIVSERAGDSVFGEEFGDAGAAHRRWVIDPIDGTSNYLRGLPMWGVLIALEIDGIPSIGVVSVPALGRRWWSAVGLGAWTNDPTGGAPRSIRVSDIDSVDRASVSFQSIAQWDEAGQLPGLIALTRAVWRDRGYGDVWPYMMLAEGRIELVAEFDVKEYDIAAVAAIVREAGGTFTSFEGEDRLDAGSSFATNGELHDALLAIAHTREPA